MQDAMVTFPYRPGRPSLGVAASAYGHDVILRHGQAGILSWLAEAGADAVEIRRELLPDGFDDFAGLGRACADHGLGVVYSAADALWQGDTPHPNIALRLAEAGALGASAIKFSLGRYELGETNAWRAMNRVLDAAVASLVMVENDQTPEGGTLAPLATFLADAERADCPLAMTFDIGNWRWTGEHAIPAARRLGRHVRYVHCKGTHTQGDRLSACVPDDATLAEWQPLMAQFSPSVPRAIEYPLQGPDLIALTRQQLERLATL